MFSLLKIYEGYAVAERYLNTLARILVVAMLFMITADVSLRTLFNSPLPGILDLTELFMVVIVFGALSYTEFTDSHIHIDIMINWYGPKAQLITKIISLFIGFIFFALLVWQGGRMALMSWQIREVTMNSAAPLPVYFSKSMVPIGSFFICIRFVVQIAECVEMLLREREKKWIP